MHSLKVFTIVCNAPDSSHVKKLDRTAAFGLTEDGLTEQIRWPACRGYRPLWCRCTGWPPSMARWGAGPRSSPGPRWPSASFWCQSAEAVEQEEQTTTNILSPVFPHNDNSKSDTTTTTTGTFSVAFCQTGPSNILLWRSLLCYRLWEQQEGRVFWSAFRAQNVWQLSSCMLVGEGWPSSLTLLIIAKSTTLARPKKSTKIILLLIK